MKINAVLLLAAVICYTEALKCTPQNLFGVFQKCLADTKTTEIDILDVLALQPARSDSAKCFRACLMKDCEYLNDNGEVSAAYPSDAGKILGSGDPEKTKNIEAKAAACLESIKHQDDLCEYTEHMFQCVLTTCKTCGIVVPKLNF